MSNELEKIIKSLKSLNLSDNEKAIMRNNILSNITLMPSPYVTNSPVERLYKSEYVANYFKLLINNKTNMSALIIALMIALSGGTAAVAENSIPGDTLYPIKTSVNEPVAGLFAVSKEANAVWQERLAERRLEEAQQVVSNGTLDPETRANIENDVKTQIDKFTASVQELASNTGDVNSSTNSSDLTTRLEAALIAHQNILKKISDQDTTSTSTKEEAKRFISSLKDEEHDVKKEGQRLASLLGETTTSTSTSSTSTVATATSTNATSTATSVSALNKQSAAEKILSDVKTKYNENKATLSTSTMSNINTKLAEADASLAQGKIDILSGNYASAHTNFQAVINLSNEARVMVLTGAIKKNLRTDFNLGDDDEDEDEEGDDEMDEEDDEDDDRPTVSRNSNTSITGSTSTSIRNIKMSDDEEGDDGEDDEDDDRPTRVNN